MPTIPDFNTAITPPMSGGMLPSARPTDGRAALGEAMLGQYNRGEAKPGGLVQMLMSGRPKSQAGKTNPDGSPITFANQVGNAVGGRYGANAAADTAMQTAQQQAAQNANPTAFPGAPMITTQPQRQTTTRTPLPASTGVPEQAAEQARAALESAKARIAAHRAGTAPNAGNRPAARPVAKPSSFASAWDDLAKRDARKTRGA